MTWLAPQARTAGAEIVVIDDGSREPLRLDPAFSDVAVCHRLDRNHCIDWQYPINVREKFATTRRLPTHHIGEPRQVHRCDHEAELAAVVLVQRAP